MNDLANWDLHGPVHTLRNESARFDAGAGRWEEPWRFGVTKFRPDGMVEQREDHNPDGSTSKSKFVYDETGRLIETHFQMDSGPVTKTVNYYDRRARLIRTTSQEPDGSIRDREVYDYEADGRKVKIHFVPLELIKGDGEYSYGVEGSDVSFTATGATVITTLYDIEGKPTEMLFHDPNHQLISKVTLDYDAKGRLARLDQRVGEKPLFPVNGIPPDQCAAFNAAMDKWLGRDAVICKVSYRYDDQGRCVERSTMGLKGMLDSRTTYTYDDQGNRLQENEVRETIGLEIDAEGNRVEKPGGRCESQVRYEYEYDEHQNWTERIVWSRQDSESDFQSSGIERRAIAYY
jgi:YD repeat-containing protein